MLKAGSWQLVVAADGGATDDEPDVRCVDNLRGIRLTRHRFTPPAGFDLVRFWAGAAGQS